MAAAASSQQHVSMHSAAAASSSGPPRSTSLPRSKVPATSMQYTHVGDGSNGCMQQLHPCIAMLTSALQRGPAASAFSLLYSSNRLSHENEMDVSYHRKQQANSDSRCQRQCNGDLLVPSSTSPQLPPSADDGVMPPPPPPPVSYLAKQDYEHEGSSLASAKLVRQQCDGDISSTQTGMPSTGGDAEKAAQQPDSFYRNESNDLGGVSAEVGGTAEHGELAGNGYAFSKHEQVHEADDEKMERTQAPVGGDSEGADQNEDKNCADHHHEDKRAHEASTKPTMSCGDADAPAQTEREPTWLLESKDDEPRRPNGGRGGRRRRNTPLEVRRVRDTKAQGRVGAAEAAKARVRRTQEQARAEDTARKDTHVEKALDEGEDEEEEEDAEETAMEKVQAAIAAIEGEIDQIDQSLEQDNLEEAQMQAELAEAGVPDNNIGVEFSEPLSVLLERDNCARRSMVTSVLESNASRAKQAELETCGGDAAIRAVGALQGKQPKDLRLWKLNARTHEQLRPALETILTRKRDAKRDQWLTSAIRYRQLHAKWRTFLRSIAPEDVARIGRRYGESEAQHQRAGPDEPNRTSQDVPIERLRSLTRLPAVENDEQELRVQNLPNNYGLVENPFADAQNESIDKAWSEAEIRVFKDKFAKDKKNFKKIANALPDRTTGECVLFYYKHQKDPQLGLKKRKAANAQKKKNAARTFSTTSALKGLIDAPKKRPEDQQQDLQLQQQHHHPHQPQQQYQQAQQQEQQLQELQQHDVQHQSHQHDRKRGADYLLDDLQLHAFPSAQEQEHDTEQREKSQLQHGPVEHMVSGQSRKQADALMELAGASKQQQRALKNSTNRAGSSSKKQRKQNTAGNPHLKRTSSQMQEEDVLPRGSLDILLRPPPKKRRTTHANGNEIRFRRSPANTELEIPVSFVSASRFVCRRADGSGGLEMKGSYRTRERDGANDRQQYSTVTDRRSAADRWDNGQAATISANAQKKDEPVQPEEAYTAPTTNTFVQLKDEQNSKPEVDYDSETLTAQSGTRQVHTRQSNRMRSQRVCTSSSRSKHIPIDVHFPQEARSKRTYSNESVSFTPQEQEIFIAGVQRLGKDWRGIANYMKTRSMHAVRQFFKTNKASLALDRLAKRAARPDLDVTAPAVASSNVHEASTEHLSAAEQAAEGGFSLTANKYGTEEQQWQHYYAGDTGRHNGR